MLDIFRVEGTKLAELGQEWDQLGMMRQLGVIPATGRESAAAWECQSLSSARTAGRRRGRSLMSLAGLSLALAASAFASPGFR